MENDLINRQTAIDAIAERMERVTDPYGYGEQFWEGLCIAKSIVADIPSTQPEIIMCNDCEHHRQNHAGDSWCGHPKGLDGFELKPTDFCSAAERRTNERKTE